MHVSQIILVQNEDFEKNDPEFDPSEVASLADSQLTDYANSYWFDWFEVGGRWDNSVVEGNVLRYTDNPEKFEAVLAEYLGYRKAEMLSLLEGAGGKENEIASLVENYDPNAGGWKMEVFRLKKLLEVLENDWTCDSAVYDLEYGSADLSGFRERVAKNPENQYLVVVDFHF
jgi:hypothetical protein